MDNNDDELNQLIKQVANLLLQQQLMVVTAESCTGGRIAQCLTAHAGSSAWFERGYVTYSNAAKQDLLTISATAITKHCAVSSQTAKAMAEGALKHSQAQIALSVTGIAGPTGGSISKPVGTVFFGWAGNLINTQCSKCCFDGNRTAVREQAVFYALAGLQHVLRSL